MTSPISTEPAAHSPPKPSPCSARTHNSCSKLCVNPARNVNSANHAIVSCSTSLEMVCSIGVFGGGFSVSNAAIRPYSVRGPVSSTT